jgi:hypothetical protein
MSYVSDAHRFRKTMAGLCMIGAPILFLISSLVSPGLDADAATAAGLIAGDANAFAAAQFLTLAGWSLFLVAALAMMHMLREKGATAGHIAGALAVIGTLCAIAQAGFGLALWQVVSNDAAAGVALLENLDGLASVVLFMLPAAVTLGGLVFAWALFHHHVIPAWMAACIGAAGITFAVGSFAFAIELYVAASALLLIGFGAMGAMVLNETVEEWEHTPEFHGIGIAGH